jgi:serine/threonine protein kinase
VALKVLSKKQISSCEVINQLRRELEIHTHIRHDNILKMFGFFFDEKRVYIILEYAPGGELYASFRQLGRFDEPLVATYVKQVILAMQYLHEQRVIHRDLKPENLLISHNHTVKLSDFGWAVHTSNSRKTFCGTIDYICPEIINHIEYDERLDLWTIGVLAYELSSGKAPF